MSMNFSSFCWIFPTFVTGEVPQRSQPGESNAAGAKAKAAILSSTGQASAGIGGLLGGAASHSAAAAVERFEEVTTQLLARRMVHLKS